MKTLSFKNILLFVLLAFALTACGNRATPEMISSMQAYADWVDVEYPDVTQNVARICAESDTVVYTNDSAWDTKSKGFISALAVTCKLSDSSYGIVMFRDETNIASAFSIYATSQKEVKQLLSGEGWK